jgi:biotin carboxyl carrier protein
VQTWQVDLDAGTVTGDAATTSVRTLPRRGSGIPGHVGCESAAGSSTSTASVQAGSVQMSRLGHVWRAEVPDLTATAATDAGGDQTVRAPMPGTVLAVRVQAGETVAAGQPVVVLEAMKMELSLPAPYAGTVAEVAITAGEQVALGAPLVVLSPPEDAAGALS